MLPPTAARVRVSEAMGYVSEAFDTVSLAKLPGAWPSVTSATRRGREPARQRAADSRGQRARPACRGHNGNIVNASELRDALVRLGAIFQSNSDTEVIVHLFARSREEGAEAAIVECDCRRCAAPISLVMMTKDRLIGVRDPHGFRPLALGRLGDAWVICSETCAMDLIGATYLRDVEPGEVVIISAHGLEVDQAVPACAASRSASSSTCISRGRTATYSARASTRSAPSWAGARA